MSSSFRDVAGVTTIRGPRSSLRSSPSLPLRLLRSPHLLEAKRRFKSRERESHRTRTLLRASTGDIQDPIGEHEPPGLSKLRKRPSVSIEKKASEALVLEEIPELKVAEKAPVELHSRTMATSDEVIPGTENEVLLQAFNWESHKSYNPSWWTRLSDLVPEIASFGITSLWLPPPSNSLAPQGYIPQDLYKLDSSYGAERELRGLLQRVRENGMSAMGDLVVNHRAGSGQDEKGKWTRYPGIRPDWDEFAVTSDTGGKGSASTGVVFEGIANIDHTQEFVRRDLKDWIAWLKDDVGFASFRFDFAKGYSAEFAKEYVEAAEPCLTVGEYWDDCSYVGEDYALDYDQDGHRQRIVDWIDGTGGQSAAFDFTTKAVLQEAVRKKEWSRLKDKAGRAPGLLGFWPSRGVTFIDNHDTGSTQAHWPFPAEGIMQGYAYILTHPGIPTVFYDHLFEWGEDTKQAIVALLKARRDAGVTCNSSLVILQADSESYVAKVGERLIVQIGASDWPDTHDMDSFVEVARGKEQSDYAVWIKEETTEKPANGIRKGGE